MVKSLIAVFGRADAPVLRLMEATFPTLILRAMYVTALGPAMGTISLVVLKGL